MGSESSALRPSQSQKHSTANSAWAGAANPCYPGRRHVGKLQTHGGEMTATLLGSILLLRARDLPNTPSKQQFLVPAATNHDGLPYSGCLELSARSLQQEIRPTIFFPVTSETPDLAKISSTRKQKSLQDSYVRICKFSSITRGEKETINQILRRSTATKIDGKSE